jgi:uncharacterized protein YeaO (DUF488 family)
MGHVMKPHVTSYRYGSARQPGEGLRLGVTRQVPRGVKREDRQRRNYFDLWLPLLSPTADLVEKFQHEKMTFKVFAQHYKNQMKAPESRQVIELLAATSLSQPISVGCFCEDESRCHRSLLRPMIVKEAKKKATEFARLKKGEGAEAFRFASPVCFADEQD